MKTYKVLLMVAPYGVHFVKAESFLTIQGFYHFMQNEQTIAVFPVDAVSAIIDTEFEVL